MKFYLFNNIERWSIKGAVCIIANSSADAIARYESEFPDVDAVMKEYKIEDGVMIVADGYDDTTISIRTPN